ncbi:MAG: DMT family protein [Caulobacteraceae bacterium]|nr:DMT family protein [Caulobacteraceae bacterium]
MLVASNVFMTTAWYGHLKFQDRPLWILILASWAIAFFEYCLVIPANRMGFASGMSLGQLKITQEVVTLVVFSLFAVLVMGEKLKWNHFAAFLCLIAAVAFVFADKLRI